MSINCSVLTLAVSSLTDLVCVIFSYILYHKLHTVQYRISVKTERECNLILTVCFIIWLAVLYG